jgi:hypothetical protein
MRLIHVLSYNLQEREALRRQVFRHVTSGMLRILNLVENLDLSLDDDNMSYVEEVRNVRDLIANEPFPVPLRGALSSLWNDPSVQVIWKHREMYSLPNRWVILSWSSLCRNDWSLPFSACRTSSLPWTASSMSHICQRIKTYCMSRSKANGAALSKPRSASEIER